MTDDISLDAETLAGGDDQIWLRQAGEPQRWFLRFQQYCRLGANRSVLGLFNAERVAKGLTKSRHASGSWRTRSAQFNWLERAQAWDRYINRRDEANWEKRRTAYRKKGTEVADLLLQKAQQMLQFPLATTEQTTQSDGGKTIVTNVIMPARWNLRDAANYIDVADKLMRLSLEMETSRATAIVDTKENIDKIRDRRWKEAHQLDQYLFEDDDLTGPAVLQSDDDEDPDDEQP